MAKLESRNVKIKFKWTLMSILKFKILGIVSKNMLDDNYFDVITKFNTNKSNGDIVKINKIK